jgi:hypothetical protein
MSINAIRADAVTDSGVEVHGTLTGTGAGKYTGIKTNAGNVQAVLKDSVVLYLNSKRRIEK